MFILVWDSCNHGALSKDVATVYLTRDSVYNIHYAYWYFANQCVIRFFFNHTMWLNLQPGVGWQISCLRSSDACFCSLIPDTVKAFANG